MAVLVRPAVWSYDLELFRAAARDDDQLEAMLAAIGLENEEIWVAEDDQQPVGFLWVRWRAQGPQVLMLFIPPAQEAAPVVRSLVERLIEEASLESPAGRAGTIEIPQAVIQGADPSALQAAGLIPQDQWWLAGS